MKNPISKIRAQFSDATAAIESARDIPDPPREEARPVTMSDGRVVEIKPGKWPGAPYDRLPPDCPVTPLGYNGSTTYFITARGDLMPVAIRDWSDNLVCQIFAETPNYKYWAWPRWGKPKETDDGGLEYPLSGLDIRAAKECLMKAAVQRGSFDPDEHLRGRGGWALAESAGGDFVWHSGTKLWRMRGQKLIVSPPGEIDGFFYPQRPPVLTPWPEPVDCDTSPAAQLLQDLRTWSWERPALDPLLVVGEIACAFLGGALETRPHTFVIGDKGSGKTTLRGVFKALIGSALHSTTETTPAGIYQRLQRDCLPVAVDELENSVNSGKVDGIIDLARLAYSKNGQMFRGGPDHTGHAFTISSAFFFFAINPPALNAADRSRMAVLNLHKLKARDGEREPKIDADRDGRMLLRQLMQGWPRFQGLLEKWRSILYRGGLTQRTQDTFGTLLAAANLLLGDIVMADAGLDPGREEATGAAVAAFTANERAEETDNWRDVIDRMLNHVIAEWKSGEKPSVGRVMEEFEAGTLDQKFANERLSAVGLAARRENREGQIVEGHAYAARHLLAVPIGNSQGIARIFDDSKWRGGVWASALKQAPHDVVIRDRGAGQNVKINRATARVLWVDLAAYDRTAEAGG